MAKYINICRHYSYFGVTWGSTLAEGEGSEGCFELPWFGISIPSRSNIGKLGLLWDHLAENNEGWDQNIEVGLTSILEIALSPRNNPNGNFLIQSRAQGPTGKNMVLLRVMLF